MESMKIILNFKLRLIIILLFLTSCITSKESAIVKNNIQPGMDRFNVEQKLGKPFKISSSKNLSGSKIDSLFYKEPLWTGSNHVTIENILIFEDNLLKEIAQGKETRDPIEESKSAN